LLVDESSENASFYQFNSLDVRAPASMHTGKWAAHCLSVAYLTGSRMTSDVLYA
jgi:hypothetical protein